MGSVASTRGVVLVVEDDPAVRSLVLAILLDEGYDAVGAGSGEEAVALVDAGLHQLALVVTDIALPGIGAQELLERLRRDFPSLCVLHMSGYSQGMLHRHGIVEPGIGFLAKPFDPDQLVRLVSDTLARADSSTPPQARSRT